VASPLPADDPTDDRLTLGEAAGTGEVRPWGAFLVLDDGPLGKVKRITVDPGQRLSYQLHHRRKEHWFVVSGTALVTLDGADHRLAPGEAIDIPVETAHRVTNPGEEPLVFVEVQQGDYFGEDDIERLDDDYGRAG
jgi:mannose-6-phosphate isomerase